MDTASSVHRGDAAAAILAPRRRRLWRWLAGTLAVSAVVGWALVAGRQLGRDPTLVESPLVGRRAPSFSLPGLDGGRVASADYRGEIYVVNFWASWCVPCREEAPHLQDFYERRSQEGVGLVGIVYNDREDKARGFRDDFGLTFPQAMDPGGRAAIDFGVFGVPETFVVDGRGVIMAKLIGGVGPRTLDEVLSRIRRGEQYTAENDRYRTSPD